MYKIKNNIFLHFCQVFKVVSIVIIWDLLCQFFAYCSKMKILIINHFLFLLHLLHLHLKILLYHSFNLIYF